MVIQECGEVLKVERNQSNGLERSAELVVGLSARKIEPIVLDYAPAQDWKKKTKLGIRNKLIIGGAVLTTAVYTAYYLINEYIECVRAAVSMCGTSGM